MMAQNERVCVQIRRLDGRYLLRLTDVNQHDIGQYTCLVHNDFGQLNFTRQLDVIGQSPLAMRSLRALIDRHLLFEKPYCALIQQSKLHKIICKPERRPEKQTGHITRVLSLYIIIRSLSPYSHTFITGIPSPTHSLNLGLNPSFSANPPYRTLSFFSFRFHYMDFPDCLLYF